MGIRVGVVTGKEEIKLSDANLVPPEQGQPNMQNIIKGAFPYYEFVDVDLQNGEAEISALTNGEIDLIAHAGDGAAEGGRLTAPIKDINIMGNGPKMLANITMVANDLAMYQGGSAACGSEETSRRSNPR